MTPSQTQALQEVNEVKNALDWALNNCSVTPELQSDLFNILTNALTSAERLIEYASSSSEKGDALEELSEWLDEQAGRVIEIREVQSKIKSLTPKEHSEGETKCKSCGANKNEYDECTNCNSGEVL